jgi:4'-phosphopantetheinyl transferase
MMQSPRILVWTAALQQVPESVWSWIGTLLDEEERARAAQFAFDRHRREYIAAHALKRMMLTAVGGAAPRSWTFETGASGKPQVGPGAGPYFNLSHCEGLVACAASNELEVGIDVEPLYREAPLEVAKAQFTPMEQGWIAAVPQVERDVAFWQVWTLKEAFIKATGRGLGQPLQDFSIAFDPLRVIFYDAALGDSYAWRFEQRRIGGTHMLALAWRDSGRQVSVTLQEMELDRLPDLVRAFGPR